jgi:hypothetical protein
MGFPMIILSLNLMGLGSSSRKLTLGRLMELQKLHIVLFRETMGESGGIIGELSKFVKEWELLLVAHMGIFGVLVIRWRKGYPRLINYVLFA